MAGFFASGHAVDLILAVMAAEFAFLTLRARGGGSWTDRALAFLPGACILLGLRVALTGGPWPGVALALAASFPFHLADLARRRL